jgi:hypothetical protein
MTWQPVAVAWVLSVAAAALADENRPQNPDPFSVASSKKGLQVQMVDDALALGIQHAALNVNISPLVALTNGPAVIEWRVDGEPVFVKASALAGLDSQVKALSERGVVISLILLAYEPSDVALKKLLLHPDYSVQAPNRLGAFNTATVEGQRTLRACFEFIAERYTRPGYPNGRAANFIVGNEVNSHWFWYNLGRAPMEKFADEYLKAVRICHDSVRKYSASGRVYLSLEHHWNIRYPGGDAQQAFPARPFLDYFARRAREGGDFEWHVAFHPYPESLFEPRTWSDKSATFIETTPRITFRNLEMLPAYLRRAELQYEGRPRRIILSEQGFHTPNGPEGEALQAAAYAYAWYRANNIPEIDSFILHRHVDHAAEGGLKLGLWRRNEASRAASEPLAKKKIYDIFLRADTAEWREAFAFALPIIGIQRWEELKDSGPERKAIAFLSREVPTWSKDNQCYSCHNNGDGARALYEAAKLGYDVPPRALADTSAWLANPAAWDKNKGDPGFSDKRLANLQFAAALAAAVRAGQVTNQISLQTAARRVAADQGTNGAWEIDAQSVAGSPATYGSVLATYMALRVLKEAGSENDAALKAEQWLASRKPANLLETATLLLAVPGERRADYISRLRQAQTAEGGWGPFPDAPQEIFDTAIALLALAQAGDANLGSAIKKGRSFLTANQNADGSWPATTRPRGGESYAQQLSTTAWATLALLHTR